MSNHEGLPVVGHGQNYNDNYVQAGGEGQNTAERPTATTSTTTSTTMIAITGQLPEGTSTTG